MEVVNGVVSYYNGEFKRYSWGSDNKEDSFAQAIGKEIHRVRLEGDDLVIRFTDDTAIKLYDDGQSCCESRYMETSDDLEFFEGATLLGGCTLDAPCEEDDYGYHEVQFLQIITNKGSFTMSSHNEHNGYYGGFSIVCTEVY